MKLFSVGKNKQNYKKKARNWSSLALEQFVERTVNFVSIDQQQMTFPDFLILMSQRRTDQKCSDRERVFVIDKSFVIVIFDFPRSTKFFTSFQVRWSERMIPATSDKNDNEKNWKPLKSELIAGLGSKRDEKPNLHPVRDLFKSYDIHRNGVIDANEMKG